MSQFVKCLILPRKHEAPSSDPLNPHKKPGVTVHSHNPGAVEGQ